MAVITRYFSTSGAGATDGTTWADRAELFSSGNWSSVITGFDFSGSDSLQCRIGPGSYSCGQALNSAGFSVAAPTAANNLCLHACDSSGDLLNPPDSNWTSDQPPYDDSSFPQITVTSSSAQLVAPYCLTRLIKFVTSVHTSIAPISGLNTATQYDWCVVDHSGGHVSAAAIAGNGYASNCIFLMKGNEYSNCMNSQFAINCRCEGNLSASNGSRQGWRSNTATPFVTGCTFIGNKGAAFASTSSSTSFAAFLAKNIFKSAPSPIEATILLPSTASQTLHTRIFQNVIIGSPAAGIDAQNATRVWAYRNRFRDNTSGSFGNFGNHFQDLGNYETAATDSDDFVDPSNGDYRIKNTAGFWGLGIGVSEEPAASGGGWGFRRRARMVGA